MEQNMQPSSLQQELRPAPLVLDDYPEVPNVPSSPTYSGQGSSHPYSAIIPPTHAHRTLVLFFEGAGVRVDVDNSNMLQLLSMLVKDDYSKQMVYYRTGIDTVPAMGTPIMSKISKTADPMVGSHLNIHVMGGYEFLMQNYEAGDKICIFGFSKGAYMARALAGMIHKVGLLPRCHYQQVPFAFNMYIRDDAEGWMQSTAFKKTFSINVNTEFVGVWDTVFPVGIFQKRLPFTLANNNVRFFRHALSLDEHRVGFTPCLWSRPTENRSFRRHFPHQQESNDNTGSPDREVTKGSRHRRLSDLERQYTTSIIETNVEEVWFAGCHRDIGGGSVRYGTRNSLARIPLRWMIRELFKLNVGILFHAEMLKQIGLDPMMLYPPVLERPPAVYQAPTPLSPGSPQIIVGDPTRVAYSNGGGFVNEELEDMADATSPMYDKLRITRGWWIMEAIPQMIHYQNDDDDCLVKQYTVNMGRGRHIPRQHRDGVKVHRSVKIRMEADDLKDGKYWPKVKLRVEPQWVD